MKNLKKVLAVMTAVSALAVSTSALAANNEAAVNGELTGSYVNTTPEAATASYKLSVGTPAKAINGKDITLLVLKEGTDTANVEDEDILYIDQGVAGTDTFSNLGLKDEIIDTVTTTGHLVRFGYYNTDTQSFAIAEGTIDVTAIQQEEPDTVPMVYGNINCDTAGLDVTDALAVLRYNTSAQQTFGATDDFAGFTLGATYTTDGGQQLTYGNVNCDAGGLDITDALAILRYNTSAQQTFGATDDFAGFTLGATYEIVQE